MAGILLGIVLIFFFIGLMNILLEACMYYVSSRKCKNKTKPKMGDAWPF